MKKHKVTLEKLLEINKDPEKEWDIMFDYLQKNSGWINRKMIKFNKYILSEEFKDSITNIVKYFVRNVESSSQSNPYYTRYHKYNGNLEVNFPKINHKVAEGVSKTLDFLLQVYIGGSMTRTDQEIFARVSNKKAKHLTLYNTIMITAFSYQYHLFVTGEGLFSKLFSTDPATLDTIGWGAVGLVCAANFVRTARAYYNDTGYASITIDGLIINSTTYLKKLKNYMKYGYSNLMKVPSMINNSVKNGMQELNNGFNGQNVSHDS